MGKLELYLKQAFDLVGYQFILKGDEARSALEHGQTLFTNPGTSLRTDLPGLAADANDSITDSYREASPHIRMPPHQADRVVLEQLEST